MRVIKKAVARALEAAGVLSLLRFLTRNTPRIIMYHRVLHTPFVTGLDPEIFEQQIIYLKQNFRVVPMSRLIAELKQRKVLPNTVAVTFDDGHSDFYTEAWPILRKHDVPATFYVTTGFVDGICWLWPDMLRYVLLNAKSTHVDVDGLGRFSLERQHVLATWSDLGDHCLELPPPQRNQFINRLAQVLAVDVPAAPVEPFASVTWDQLREMKSQGLDVGSHTSTHPILSLLDASAIEAEFAASAARIEQEMGDYPKGICYPNGRLQDVNADVIRKAQELNFEYGVLACNARPDPDDLYRIGRVGAVTNMRNFKWRVAGIDRAVKINKSFDEY